MASERRQSIRTQIPLDAVVQTADAYFYAETRDLSEAGLALRTQKPFPVGTHLHLVLGQPPRLPRIDLDGVVKWLRNGDSVGVEFTPLSPRDRAVISAFLGSLPEESYPIN